MGPSYQKHNYFYSLQFILLPKFYDFLGKIHSKNIDWPKEFFLHHFKDQLSKPQFVKGENISS